MINFESKQAEYIKSSLELALQELIIAGKTYLCFDLYIMGKPDLELSFIRNLNNCVLLIWKNYFLGPRMNRQFYIAQIRLRKHV